MAQGPRRIAQQLRDLGHGLLLAHRLQGVAEVQGVLGVGHEFDLRPGRAGHHHAVAAGQVELAQGLAQHLLVGDDDAAGDDVAGQAAQVHVALAAHDQDQLLEPGLGPHGQEHVADMQDRVALGHAEPALVEQAGEAHAQALQGRDAGEGQAVEIAVLDLDVHPGQVAGVPAAGLAAGLPGQVDAPQPARQDHGQDGAQDAEGVGHGVADARQPGGLLAQRADVLEGLLGRGQAGRVGHGPRVEAHGRGHLDAAQAADQHGQGRAEEHHGGGQEVEPQARLAQRGEEARPDLHADGVDEEDEPELAQELQDLLVDRDPEVPEGDAGEEHPRDAQVDPEQPDVAHGQAQGRDQADDDDGVRDGVGRDHRGRASFGTQSLSAMRSVKASMPPAPRKGRS